MATSIAGYRGQRVSRRAFCGISLCKGCWCMTKTIKRDGKEYCGKCGEEK